jgi:hypothetical protein
MYMLSIWEPTRSVSIYHVHAAEFSVELYDLAIGSECPVFFQVRLSFNATSLALKEKGSGSWLTNVTCDTGRVTLDPAAFGRRKVRSAGYGTITNNAMIQCGGLEGYIWRWRTRQESFGKTITAFYAPSLLVTRRRFLVCLRQFHSIRRC